MFHVAITVRAEYFEYICMPLYDISRLSSSIPVPNVWIVKEHQITLYRRNTTQWRRQQQRQQRRQQPNTSATKTTTTTFTTSTHSSNGTQHACGNRRCADTEWKKKTNAYAHPAAAAVEATTPTTVTAAAVTCISYIFNTRNETSYVPLHLIMVSKAWHTKSTIQTNAYWL